MAGGGFTGWELLDMAYTKIPVVDKNTAGLQEQILYYNKMVKYSYAFFRHQMSMDGFTPQVKEVYDAMVKICFMTVVEEQECKANQLWKKYQNLWLEFLSKDNVIKDKDEQWIKMLDLLKTLYCAMGDCRFYIKYTPKNIH